MVKFSTRLISNAGLFPLLLISLLLHLCEADTHETLAKKSVSGRPFYLREITPSYQILEVYDTLYPIVFEYTTPNWSRPIQLIGYTCTGDDYDNDGWSCPVLWHWLTGVRDKLQEEIYVENMKQPDNSSFRTAFDCDQLREVFEGLYLSAEEISRFLSFLQDSGNCQPSRTTIVGKSDKYVANGIDAPYRTMREKFFSDYYRLQTPVNRSNDAMYTNARYNYYSSGMFDYYVESRRWTAGLESCKDKRLPNSLIPPSELEPLLRQVAENASSEGLELVLGLDKISRYYKYQGLVDCAFTPDSMIVFLQVPVKMMSSARNPQFLELIPVPYQNDKGEVCWIEESERKFAVLNGRVLPYMDDFRCHKSRLCRVEAEVDVPVRKTSCYEALYKTDDDEDACKITCTNKTSKLPITTRITDDRVVVFGTGKNPTKEVKIVCPSFQKMEPIDAFEKAVEVTLPCGCEIHKAGKPVYMAKGNCGGEVHVIRI